MEIITKIEIPPQRIENLICSAFEGGSAYWATLKSKQEPTEFVFKSDDHDVRPYYDYPLNPGGSLTFVADNDWDAEEINGKTEFVLNLEAIERGLGIMAKEHPGHFANFINEDDDAETADVFLQLSLFGELVFG